MRDHEIIEACEKALHGATREQAARVAAWFKTYAEAIPATAAPDALTEKFAEVKRDMERMLPPGTNFPSTPFVPGGLIGAPAPQDNQLPEPTICNTTAETRGSAELKAAEAPKAFYPPGTKGSDSVSSTLCWNHGAALAHEIYGAARKGAVTAVEMANFAAGNGVKVAQLCSPQPVRASTTSSFPNSSASVATAERSSILAPSMS